MVNEQENNRSWTSKEDDKQREENVQNTVLLQNGRPVVYASRSLQDTETKYAQIEKEMLAIVWSVEHFHQYTFGKHIVVQSDHKPLESLMCKPLSKGPAQITRHNDASYEI